MNTKSFTKIAFSFALVAVMLTLFAGTSVAQKHVVAEFGLPSCPTMECPSDLSGYTFQGNCEITLDHGCVVECNTFAKGRNRCRTNCHNQ